MSQNFNSWWTRYVGIPYMKDQSSFYYCDCRGLVRLVYKEELRSDDFPAYAMISAADISTAAIVITEEMASGRWQAIPHGQEKPFDIAVIHRIAKVGGTFRWGPFHLGVVTQEGHVLHCDEDTGTVEMCFRDTAIYRRHPQWGRQSFSIWRRAA